MSTALLTPYIEEAHQRLGERATPDVLAVAEALERYAAADGRLPDGRAVVEETGLPSEEFKAALSVLGAAGLFVARGESRDGTARIVVPGVRVLRSPDREVDYRCSVMDHPGLSVGARYTGVAIVRHCFRKLELFAGMDTVAEWIGLSPESRKQAGKYVEELAKAGFLDPIGKAGRSIKYRLTIPERVDPPH
ncbi:hypothetical protein [Pseudonocardia hydrocarbonoxydans]|uniref:Uncharacterized protein n=1 Tax=Pseudonocardia hydrocarbonoxydans TaxID=76726 RepID=A0A4Y3WUW3_9PSEU|nr:hypothetical protein [Pseudonocardia hydrocarbonoxydans]GEC21860.1 hypothetical protein PHY01_41430 [Pseudonocardia hydrocarbonoxydans]